MWGSERAHWQHSSARQRGAADLWGTKFADRWRASGGPRAASLSMLITSDRGHGLAIIAAAVPQECVKFLGSVQATKWTSRPV